MNHQALEDVQRHHKNIFGLNLPVRIFFNYVPALLKFMQPFFTPGITLRPPLCQGSHDV
jgi:hypothetical protein